MVKLIDDYAKNDGVVSSYSDTFGLRTYWGSSRRFLGNSFEDTFSILREINIDGYFGIVSVSVIMFNNKLINKSIDIICDVNASSMINKDRVIFEISNFIDVVTNEMNEDFEYLYTNTVYAIQQLVGYVENCDLGNGVNLAYIPDIN